MTEPNTSGEEDRRQVDTRLGVNESRREEAEHFRRLAEEARERRDQHREALEVIRQEQEQLPRPPASSTGMRMPGAD